MRIVQRAELPPAKCAITGDIDGPFIDTECWLPEADPRIYLHVPVVEQMARDYLGMATEQEAEELREAVAHLTDMLAERDEQLKAYKSIERAARSLVK